MESGEDSGRDSEEDGRQQTEAERTVEQVAMEAAISAEAAGTLANTKEMVSTRLAGAHAGQCQQAPWISASIRISLPNIYKPIETESETLYPTHHCSMP